MPGVKLIGVRVTLIRGPSDGLASAVRGMGGGSSADADGAGAGADSCMDTGDGVGIGVAEALWGAVVTAADVAGLMLRSCLVWLKPAPSRVTSSTDATTRTAAAAVIIASSTWELRYQGGFGGAVGASFQYRAQPGKRSSVSQAPRSSYGRASRSVIAIDGKPHPCMSNPLWRIQRWSRHPEVPRRLCKDSQLSLFQEVWWRRRR